MAEDTCVFLVTAGICGDLAVLDVVVSECRVVKNKTVFRDKILVYAVKGLNIVALVLAKTCENAPTLRLDEYLALFTLV